MIQGVEHLALCVENLASVVSWYQKMFQVEVIKEGGSGPIFLKFPGGFLIELIEAAGCTTPIPEVAEKGFRHFALAVVSLEEMARRLKEENVEVVDDVRVVPGPAKLFMFRDIEGNLIQLVERAVPLFPSPNNEVLL